MATRHLDWTRDELILALDLYFREPSAQGNPSHPAVLRLSDLLRSLPIYPSNLRGPAFRNANGVGMKLANFRTCDPRYLGGGMPNGSRREKEVWAQFAGNLERLHATAAAIAANAQLLDPVTDLNERELAVAEGGILYRLHKRRERDRGIVQRKKLAVQREHGSLRCEVCYFDFAETYGMLGEFFAECHHTRPIAQMLPTDRTRLRDLSIVCANCHRMLHRSGQPLSITELRRLLADQAHDRAIKASFLNQ